MNIEFPDLIAIFLFGFGVLICLVMGIQLLTRTKGLRQTNLFLGLLLVLYSLTLINNMMAMTGVYSRYQFLYFIPIYFTFSIGPLFYFFVKSRIQSGFRFQKHHLIHFILPALQFIFYLSIGFRSQEFKSWIWREVIQPYGQYIEEGVLAILTFGYLYAAFHLLRREIPSHLWQHPVFKWLKRFTLSLFVLYLLDAGYEVADWFLYGWYEFNLFNTTWGAFPLHVSYAAISFLIGYHAYLHQHQELIVPPLQEEKKRSGLEEQINELFEKDNIHLDPELNLEVVAKMLAVPKNTISKTLSDQGTTFRNKVNQHRVETFIHLVNSGREKHLSLLGIAFEAGFNSKASFNRSFLKQKGVSPTVYFEEQNRAAKRQAS